MADKDMAVRSFTVVGKKEDITDFVTAIDPDQTLLTNKFGKTSVKSTEHAWLNDSLRPAMENAYQEAVDFDSQKANPRKRDSNYVQKFLHGYSVTDTTQAIAKYGVSDELGYQMVKATKEIGRDLEYAIVRNKAKVMGDDAVAGKMGGIPYFLENFKEVTADTAGKFTLANHKFVNGDVVVFRGKGSNALDTKLKANTQYFVKVLNANEFNICATEQETTATAPTIITPTAAIANGKCELTSGNAVDAGAVTGANQSKLTFDLVNDAMQAAWSRGGSIDFAVMSGKNKRVCSGFTQGTTKNREQTSKELVEVVDVLETDFGRIDLVSHRMYTDDVVDLIEAQYWKLGYLIPFHVEDGLRKGTYKSKYITGDATLECTAPIANARIYNITK